MRREVPGRRPASAASRNWLREAGHDALHTLDLALGNRTADGDLATLAVREQRIVITNDADFVQSFLVSREPDRLLLVTTGNIANAGLERLMRVNLQAIVAAFESHHFVEIGRSSLVIHE